MTTELRLKAYNIIAERVEDGIEVGYRKAMENGSDVSADEVVTSIYSEVMLALTEIIDFPD